MRGLKSLGFVAALLALTFVSLSAAAGGHEGGEEAMSKPPVVLITGSNRGIGLALAQHYAKAGSKVIATARTPAKADDLKALAKDYDVVIEELDVTDFDQIDALAAKYKDQPIDILINNAGILGGNDRQQFGTFEFEAFDDVMAVNVKGPLKMTEAFIDIVAASDQKKIVNISSTVGSIKMTWGGQVFYRSSKAALNMATRSLAKEMRRSEVEARRGIIFALISPGVVDTDFAGADLPIPMLSPAESADFVVARIDEYVDVKKDSGRYVEHNGVELPW